MKECGSLFVTRNEKGIAMNENRNKPQKLERLLKVALGKDAKMPEPPMVMWLDHVSDTEVFMYGRRGDAERSILALDLRTGWFRRIGCAAAGLGLPGNKHGRVLFEGLLEEEEIAELRRRLGEAVEVLRRIEWLKGAYNFCPNCRSKRKDGHDECELAKCLREAEEAAG